MSRAATSASVRSRTGALAFAAQSAPSDVMRYLAGVAVSRGYTQESLAKILDVRSSTVLRFFQSASPQIRTVEKIGRGLGLDVRYVRARYGYEALTPADVTHFGTMMPRAVAVASCFEDALAAWEATRDALARLDAATRRFVLARFALESAVGLDWPVGSEVFPFLFERAQMPLPAVRVPTTNDDELWMLAEALRALGFSPDEALRRVRLDADELLRSGVQTVATLAPKWAFFERNTFARSTYGDDATYERATDALGISTGSVPDNADEGPSILDSPRSAAHRRKKGS